MQLTIYILISTAKILTFLLRTPLFTLPFWSFCFGCSHDISWAFSNIFSYRVYLYLKWVTGPPQWSFYIFACLENIFASEYFATRTLFPPLHLNDKPRRVVSDFKTNKHHLSAATWGWNILTWLSVRFATAWSTSTTCWIFLQRQIIHTTHMLNKFWSHCSVELYMILDKRTKLIILVFKILI